MNVITKKLLASQVVERWAKQYMIDDTNVKTEYINSRFRDKGEIYGKLVALGPDPDSDDVDEAIGNTSWTTITCDECDKDVVSVIQVGQPVDYESNTACICWDCLKKAHSMLGEEKIIRFGT